MRLLDSLHLCKLKSFLLIGNICHPDDAILKYSQTKFTIIIPTKKIFVQYIYLRSYITNECLMMYNSCTYHTEEQSESTATLSTFCRLSIDLGQCRIDLAVDISSL